MIITKTPLRVSFFGGSTDIPAYYHASGGLVLSTTIDKYIYVTVKRRFDDKIRVGYSKTELVDHVDELQHELIREALRCTGFERGLEINTMADIPSTGSGLGSSSSVTVGTLLALYALRGEKVTAERLAQEACAIEISILGKPIGKQDQYAAAYGGLNLIEFARNGDVTVSPLDLDALTRDELQDNLTLFYTGLARRSEDVLGDQLERLNEHAKDLDMQKNATRLALQDLENGYAFAFGDLLDTAWKTKKRLSPNISNSDIDAMYETARNAGARGGKIVGAGGGGFLLLYVPQNHQAHVREALSNLRELPFRFERGGARVIFESE